MSSNVYHWCLVPECTNTSIKTSQKLWIQLPSDIKMRYTWLKLAGRDPKLLSTKTRLYFCEDHFDLENDMVNYTEYKLMGSVKRVRMKPNCVPSRFDCQTDRKHKCTSEPRYAFVKRQRISTISEKTIQNEKYDILSLLPSCSQGIF
ncbi:uncharacterized protein LOC114365884 [Ostrinia furnacalis]|uniref:uncharacterized protein LOC114365884 n=1 Tax=Ostrinia furnacalis TaxID=93504 RepID=UPI0010408FF1|nr:uncharacterized protein LOC114365884 [Ostrinia furnacalis]